MQFVALCAVAISLSHALDHFCILRTMALNVHQNVRAHIYYMQYAFYSNYTERTKTDHRTNVALLKNWTEMPTFVQL